MDTPGEPPAAAEPTWTVYRQDDNGNRFVVEKHLSREEAERMVAKFEARGHKQLYWSEVDASR
jgi:UDP-N-acetyl-2-amino-2-deoxyglucuronate dehydrogenase